MKRTLGHLYGRPWRYGRAPAAGPGRRRRMWLALLAVLAVHVAADLFWPLDRDLAGFDPMEAGMLETNMWRSYYDRRQLALFLQLA